VVVGMITLVVVVVVDIVVVVNGDIPTVNAIGSVIISAITNPTIHVLLRLEQFCP